MGQWQDRPEIVAPADSSLLDRAITALQRLTPAGARAHAALDGIEVLVHDVRQTWLMPIPGEAVTFDRDQGRWVCLGQAWQGVDRPYSPRGYLVPGEEITIPLRPHLTEESFLRAPPDSTKLAGYRLNGLYEQLMKRLGFDPSKDGWVAGVNQIFECWDSIRSATQHRDTRGGTQKWATAERAGIKVGVVHTVRDGAERPEGLGPMIIVDLRALWAGKSGQCAPFCISESPKNRKYLN